LHRKYGADFILNALEQLHSNFFPVPVKATVTNGNVAFESQTEPAFDKASIIAVYHTCANVLHRGTLDKIGILKTEDSDFQAIRDWPSKTRNLITSHLIRLEDGSTLWAHIDSDKTAYFERLTQVHR